MEKPPGKMDSEDCRVVRSRPASAAAGESPIRSGEAADFDRLKRLEQETLRRIETFSAGDRLPREEIYRRGRR